MTVLREATAKIQRLSGSVNRPSFLTEESVLCYWETTSQIITGSDGNEIKSIAYGDFDIDEGIKKGDKINSVTQRGITLLNVPSIVKEVGVFPNFNRTEVYI